MTINSIMTVYRSGDIKCKSLAYFNKIIIICIIFIIKSHDFLKLFF